MRENYREDQIERKIAESLIELGFHDKHDPAQLGQDVTLESLGCDDLDTTDLRIDLEDEFSVDLSNIDIKPERTIGDVVNLVIAVIDLVAAKPQ